MPDLPPPHRSIRSYVLRQGRMTPGQKRQYDGLFPYYGITPSMSPINFERCFGRVTETVLEIGFGMGDSLVEMAAAKPEQNFLGIEVHKPGVARLMMSLSELKLTNVRIIHDDAINVLKTSISDHSLQGAHLYFPDPWHKKKHNKRRIVQPSFIELIHQKLVTGGYLHIATDWADYAEHIDIVLAQSPLKKIGHEDDISYNTIARPLTRFEARGKRLGHDIFEFLYVSE